MSDELIAAKEALVRQKADSQAQARALMDRLNAPFEAEVDRLVRDAVAAGTSKSAIAKLLGESRVTVNARLNAGHKVVASPRVIEEPVEELPGPYTIVDGGSGDHLRVEYVNYGPDKVSGICTYEIIEDEPGRYWFLTLSDTPNEVDRVLDTQFDGWYYEDAENWVMGQLNKGDK